MYMKLLERFIRFMQGRYGVDQLTKVLFFAAFLLWIVGRLLMYKFLYPGNALCIFALIVMTLAYSRAFSKNINARARENQTFLAFCDKIKNIFSRNKKKSDFKIFKCSNCKQKIRIPRGKGKIAITCPKCKKEFIRRT